MMPTNSKIIAMKKTIAEIGLNVAKAGNNAPKNITIMKIPTIADMISCKSGIIID